MANPFTEYLRQTRSELRHVAWPTRTQTIVYAVLVGAISVGVALYLGLFDFLFTTGLTRLLRVLPQGAPQTTTAASTSPLTITRIPAMASTTPTGGSPHAPTPHQ